MYTIYACLVDISVAKWTMYTIYACLVDISVAKWTMYTIYACLVMRVKSIHLRL